MTTEQPTPEERVADAAKWTRSLIDAANDEARKHAQEILDAKVPSAQLAWAVGWLGFASCATAALRFLYTLDEVLNDPEKTIGMKQRALRITVEQMRTFLMNAAHGAGASTNQYANAFARDELQAAARFFPRVELHAEYVTKAMQDRGLKTLED